VSNAPAIALAVAAGVYVVTRPGDAPGGKKTYEPKGSQRLTVVQNSMATKYAPLTGRASTYLDTAKGKSVPKEVSDKFIALARAEWNKLTGEKKRQACQQLKNQFPNDPNVQAIDCGAASFDQMIKVGGAAASIAACAATGIGAAASALCGPIGAWIAGWAGSKVQEWAQDAWDVAGDGADYLKDKAVDLIDSLF